MQDMSGKTVLITGPTNGIGRATAVNLAKAGANLHLLCRNAAKARTLQEDLRKVNPEIEVEVLLCDLGDFASVRQAASAFEAKGLALDVLINNAGILNTKHVVRPDGIEEMFAVNHLGHFLLTHLLMPALLRAPAARVVVVASGAYLMCKTLRLDDLAWAKGFRPLKAYGHSKLANILFMRALAKRLEGSAITVNALHPGEVTTGLGRQNGWWVSALHRLASPFFRNPNQGAATSLYLAMSPDVEGLSGEYFDDCKVEVTKPWGADMNMAEDLWTASEALVGGVPSLFNSKAEVPK
ncbi:SDR family oxidoreductase [Cognatishimia maritima]|uniref:Short-chain dehydrogenase n=1 Tax=Cognatishimia maritima TaxID=870908 RepID=A0A1M5KCR9_9RHOB|nr:SDR family oxidoreductase [Cognatishimia maritima]SHG50430.1 Short-chain dehydrogenase [Cognatishimia maritima]